MSRTIGWLAVILLCGGMSFAAQAQTAAPAQSSPIAQPASSGCDYKITKKGTQKNEHADEGEHVAKAGGTAELVCKNGKLVPVN